MELDACRRRERPRPYAPNAFLMVRPRIPYWTVSPGRLTLPRMQERRTGSRPMAGDGAATEGCEFCGGKRHDSIARAIGGLVVFEGRSDDDALFGLPGKGAA